MATDKLNADKVCSLKYEARKQNPKHRHKKESKCKIICVGLKKKLANEREIYTTINHLVIYILSRG